MKRVIYRLAALVALILAGQNCAIAQATDPFIGEIQIFAYNFCPLNWVPASGQLMAISQNTALFSLLGTTYGGNGTTNFQLPNWNPVYTANGGKLIVCIALYGVFPSRN